jgi:transglutaminase-like putative cysteine protease
MTFSVFDPVTMGEMDVGVRVVGEETMAVMGQKTSVKKLAVKAKGMTQYSFVDATGRVVREEGLLGITLVAATRQDALKGIVAGDDLTLAASVIPVWNLEPSKGDGIDQPVDEGRNFSKPPWNDRVKTCSKLSLKISGIDPLDFDLDGGRQILCNNRLTIIRESPGSEPSMSEELSGQKAFPGLGSFLEPGPLVQSDHPDIQALADKIMDSQGDNYNDIREDSQGSANGKIRAVLTWMDEHIQKRPLVSLPNAISTLETRMGDCNEHAVLFAALCRSLGIPTRIEAGLVFLNDRFYYHAWNGVFLGSWITVDPLFNQFPADVTHLRLVSGQGGEGFDILGAIGRIKVEITGVEP